MAVRPFLALLAALVITLLAAASPVLAHTDFDFSLPTDGASVGDPVDEITVAFTLPVTLVGNGFEVLDPQGNVIEPFAVTDDDRVFRLQLDPPLAGGAVGVRYAVRAEDGHELTGAFSFTVDATPPTAPPTTAPPTTPSSTTAAPTAVAETTAPATAPADPTDAAASASTSASSDGPTASSIATASTSGSVEPAAVTDADGEGGGGLGLVAIIVGAVVVGAAGFFLVRSRSSAPA